MLLLSGTALARAPEAVAAVVPVHAHLLRSEPAKDTTIAKTPPCIRLWFSEAPQLPLTAIMLTGSDGKRVTLAAVSRDAKVPTAIMAKIVGALAPGRYTVTWATSAADAHPVKGSYDFTVGKVATGSRE